MTALDSCHWFRADCTLLNTDLGSVYDASASLAALAQALTKMKKNDKVVVVEEEDEDFLHLTWTGGAVTNRGGLNPRLDPLLGGLPQRLDKNQFEAPLQCHWTLLTWSYFNCKVTLTLVMLTWSGSERERETTDLIYGRGRQRKDHLGLTPLFLLRFLIHLKSAFVCVCVCVSVWVRVRACI